MEVRILKDYAAVIISYARYDNVLRMVQQLRVNGIERIYINFDGTVDDELLAKRSRLLERLKAIKSERFHISVKVNVYNWGPAVSVIRALDSFFENEDFGLILEDDLEFDQDFLTFVRKYQSVLTEDSDCWMLAGSNLIDSQKKPFFLNYPQTWGWATSDEKWHLMRSTLLTRSTQEQVPLSRNVFNFWKIGATRSLDGIIDAWDIPLAFQMRTQSKRTLVPPQNLVSNNGNDEFATHTESLQPKQRSPLTEFDAGVIESENIETYNRKFEREVFRIGKRHFFSNFKAKLIDRKRSKKSTFLELRLLLHQELETSSCYSSL